MTAGLSGGRNGRSSRNSEPARIPSTFSGLVPSDCRTLRPVVQGGDHIGILSCVEWLALGRLAVSADDGERFSSGLRHLVIACDKREAFAQGSTCDEAIQLLRDAKGSWIARSQ